MSDLISRQAVLDGIAEWIVSGYADSEADCSHISSLVTHLPSVENKGEWIAQDIHNCCTEFKCSKCGYLHNFIHLYGEPTADYPYCPNCGTDMRGE